MASNFFELNDIVSGKVIDSDGAIEARFSRIELETENSAQIALREAQKEIERLKAELTNNAAKERAKSAKLLDSATNEITYAFSGKPGWHDSGHKLPENASVKDAIEASKIKQVNWDLTPIEVNGHDTGICIPVRRENGTPMKGVSFSPKYNGGVIEQFHESFMEFDGVAPVETIGTLFDGRKAFLCFQPKIERIFGDNIAEKRLVVMLCLDGTKPSYISPAITVPVCANTNQHNLDAAGNFVKNGTALAFKRSKSHGEKMAQIASLMKSAETSFDRQIKVFRAMNKPITSAQLQSFVEELFPASNSRKKTEVPKQTLAMRERVIQLFESGPGSDIQGKTVYGAYSAATHYNEWERRLNGEVMVGERWVKAMDDSAFNDHATHIALRLVLSA